MDIRCRRCGEPWDIDTLHDAAEEQDTTFEKVYKAFRTVGCEAIGWGTCEEDENVSPAIGALADLLGDDVDGFAAMLDDAELGGLI